MSELKVYNFMRFGTATLVLSVALVLISVVSLATRGLNFGLDFTGGTLIELHYSEAPRLEDVRRSLAGSGFENASVVNFGSDTELLVRLKADTADKPDAEIADIGAHVVEVLRQGSSAEINLVRSEILGSQVGEELANNGGLGMLTAFAMIFIYIAVRFQFKFSVSAVVALVHDAIVVLGVFSVFQLEFDLTVLAALLAVIGYSINDTIVIADRIRENFPIMRSETPLEVVNISLSQTLGRTLMTSGTTLLVVLALFFMGGELIRNFSLALLVGITVGTYSSIYVAAATLLAMRVSREDLMPPVKEGAELDEMP